MKRIFVFLSVVVLSCGAVMVAGEVALRATGFSEPAFYQPDAELGWTLRPGSRGVFRAEGRSQVQIGQAGFRDGAHDLLKPRGAYRIALLGDSSVEAMQVEFRSTFGWQLQEKLAQCAPAGAEVEVMNFGVSGYGTAQELLLLERTAIKYQPDLVLLAFSGDDVANNSARLESRKDRPFFRLDEARNLKLDTSFARIQEPEWAPMQRAAADKLRLVQAWPRARAMIEALMSGTTAQATEQEKPAQLAPPRDAAWEEAWTITERLIDRMRDYSARNGARFAMTVVPYAAQVNPDPRLRHAVQGALGVPDLFYVERRMEALGRKDGFPVIPLAQEMQRRADAEHVYLHGFRNTGMGTGHWNEDGHRMAADLLSRRLCQEAFVVEMTTPQSRKPD